MHRSARRSRFIAAASASVIGLSLAATSHVGSSAATAAPDGNGRVSQAVSQRLAPPGPAGPAITLDDQVAVSGLDIATDHTTNTSYVAWISSSYANTTLRDIHLCVLPQGAGSCSGGVLTGDAIGDSSAAGIQVEVTAPGVATLVWYHDAVGTGKLSRATYSGGALGPSSDIVDTPNNGMLFDVAPGPGGQLYAVTRSDSGNAQNLQVRPGLTGSPQNVTAPFAVGNASLAFAGSKAILLIAEAGPIADPLYYASGTPWTNFKPVPKTWTLAAYNDLVATKRGVRMIGSENNANYRPVVGKWTGSEFSTPRLIGDRSICPALTHDLETDPSGRLANVSERCGVLGVYNLPQTTKAAITKFSSGGTIASFSSAPQISTTKRGRGWVAWAILSPTNNGTKLFVRPVRLPALMVTKGAKKNGNKVTVKGPVSCLPVVTVKATVGANPARGWSVVSRQLKLDGDNEGRDVTIDGAKLKEGSEHVLVGKAVFKRGGQRVTVTKRFVFKAC